MSAIFCLSKTRQNKQVTVASSFNPSKSHQKCQKGTMKLRRFFNYRNYIEKSTSKRRQFFAYQNYVEKSMSKQRRFSIHQNYIEESMPK